MSASRRLRTARHTRRQIAAVFKRLGNGDVTLEQLLADPPPCLKHVRIHTLICAAPKMGDRGTEKTLRDAKVWPTHQVGSLTLAQRKKVVACLPPRARMS